MWTILKYAAVVGCTMALAPSVVMADLIDFSDWKEQRLSLFSSNDYEFDGQRLGIASDGAISIAWAPVPDHLWGASTAQWNWAVDQSVPATDLRLKGGDDRNISLYFVYLPKDQADDMRGRSIRRLLGNTQVRILQYVFGGDHARGTFIPSPYGPKGQGASVVLRPAGRGGYAEAVNLAQNFQTAFGHAPLQLVGLAVSGDSDDTNSMIRAEISDLRLR